MIRPAPRLTLFPYTTLFRSSVIRRKDNNQPYIPGSSLKGKLRSLLERSMGISDFKNHNNSISILFGSTDNSSRILVRDRSEEHTSELQSRPHLVCRLLLEQK